ncbi:MAG: hypothetical protein IT452_01035 [Planctomycetia bacterium]|nr:hypothetical protein [Planctomycetia bacterium]
MLRAFAVAVLAVPLAVALLRAEDEPAPPPSFPPRPAGGVDASADGVAAAVRGLAADDAAEREAAAARLFWIGEPSRPALEGALQSKDAEVVSQARQVLALLDARKSLAPLDGAQRAGVAAMVGSEKEDKDALGGFYHSPNVPVAIPDSLKAPENAVSVLVDTAGVAVVPPRTLGMIVRIVNRTREEAAFSACDSVIRLVLEAKDKDGKWWPLEDEPESFCGNSYHRAFLPEKKMWVVAVPVYAGEFRTKLRYRLWRSYQEGSDSILSAEFDGAVNPALIPAGGEKK